MSLNNLVIHTYLKDCLKHNVDMIVIKSKRNDLAEVHSYVNDSSGPKKIQANELDLKVSYNDIEKYLELFSFNSSEIKEGFSRYALEARNILIDSQTGVVIGKISQAQQREQETTIQISFIKTNYSSIKEVFFIPLETSMLIQKVRKDKKGIILLNNTDKCGTVVLNEILDSPRFFDIRSLEQHWEDVLDNSSPSVLLHQFEDPVDGFINYVEKAKQGAVVEPALKKLLASVTLKSLRRQCGVCAKPTTISSESKQKFPDFFKSRIPESYQFSRGCTQCGYTSYKGLTFIESVFIISDQLKSAMKLNVEPQTVFQEFFSKKDASIYENAINQMSEGKVSVEEVTRILPAISNAYNAYLHSDKSLITHAPSKSAPQSCSDKQSILIVEDDENQREVLKVVFSNEGYEVLTAQNGKEALSVISESAVNIILSDLMMPEMNGLELLKFCKKDATLKSIPIIVLTASSNPDHELKLLEEGADDYCPKNVKKKVLLKRVENLLARSGQSINPVRHFLED